MIATIMQPTYLPWIGYFALMDEADRFVFLDNVQFEKQSWQQRNRIKTSNGWTWLSVPVIRKFPQRIDATRINNSQNWMRKQWKTIEQNYRRARYWERYRAPLSEIYSRNWEHLVGLNLEIIFWLMEEFGIHTETLRASKLPVSGEKVSLLIDICRYLGASVYLSPAGSACYIEEDNQFNAEGISLEYQRYKHPIYRQLYGEFISHMAAIDLLFNEGPNSLAIIRSGRDRK